MPPAPTITDAQTAATKPKRAPTAYFLFADSVRPGLMEENKKANSGKAKVAEVAKAIGELWKKLGDKEKAKFEEQAKEGKDKQAVEMQAYKEANRDPLTVLKEKYADLIPKKPPTSAYWIYAQDEASRSKAEKSLKDAGEEASHKKITIKLGEMWKALSETDKAPFEKLLKKAIAEYEQKKKIWEATPEFVEFDKVEKEHKEKAKEEKKEQKEKEKEEKVKTSPKKDGKREAPSEGENSPPPAKKSKVEKPAKVPKAAKNAKPQAPVIEPDVLKKAQSLNLEASLKNLLGRPEIATKEFPQAKLLDELVNNGGLVNKAKHALLGA